MKASTQTALRRVLNYILYLVMCFMIGTGFMLDMRLPHGRANRGLSVFDMTRHEWGDLHTWAGYTLGVLVLAHLWLARSWLMNIAVKRRSAWMYAGLAVGLIIIALLLLTPVSQPSSENAQGGQRHEESH